jgi:hypothetical protein
MANINRTLRDAQIARIDPGEARGRWDRFREANGYRPGRPLLTQPSENMKLAKDMVTSGLSLAQANTSGVANVCPFSTAGCRAACVAKNGNGRYASVADARALRTRFLMADPSAFLTLLAAEIDAAGVKHGAALRVRLNTFSDIRWEEIAPWLLSGARAKVKFYDYTKDWARIPPANYRLTLSVSERTTDTMATARVSRGANVAVVFTTRRTDPLPAEWHGIAVFDGDKTDNRADDPTAVVVGLRAKGSMRQDTTGMVREP